MNIYKNQIVSIRRRIILLRDWAFNTDSPTRMIELISGSIALLFSASFIMDIGIHITRHPYSNFSYLSSRWLWVIMFILSILQLVYAMRSTLKSNMKSAQILLWFSLVWIIIAMIVGSDYPPVSIDFYIFLVLSVATLVAYFYLDHLNKSKIKEIN